MREHELAQERENYFYPVLAAVALHALLFALLFVSFSSKPELPPATPIIKATLYQLQSQSSATTPTPHKIAGEAEKTKAPLTQNDQLEQKKAEQDKLVAAAKAKQEADRKAEAERKAAEDAKQAAEQKKTEEAKKAEEAAKAAKLKSEQEAKLKAEQEAKKKAEEEAKRKQAEEKRKADEAKRKQQEEAKRKAAAEEKRKRDKEAAERKALEDKKAAALAEMMGTSVQHQQTTAQTHGSQVAGSLDDLIRRLVGEAWIRPPSARNGMRVKVRINMLPDGTITNVSVVNSSGDRAFDMSAVSAVKAVGRIPEMQQLDSATFNARYRQRDAIFSPEDLSL